MEIPQNILRELEERKARAILGDTPPISVPLEPITPLAPPEPVQVLQEAPPTSPISPIGPIKEPEPEKPVEAGFKISFSFPKFFGKKSKPVLASTVEAPQRMNLNIPIYPPLRPDISRDFAGQAHKPTGIELLFEYLSKAAVYLAIFLTPLFFMASSDALGLSKQLLLSILALVSVVGWVGNVISSGNISWRKNALMWPALLVALSAVFSSFFSGGFWVSFLGDAGRFAFSGISILSYIIVFFVALQSFNKKDFTVSMWLWLSSVFLASLFGLAQIFGKFILPWGAYNLRTFNTVGSVFHLSLFAVSSVPFIAAFFQFVKNWRVKSVLLIMAAVQIVCAALVDFKVAWISLAISGIVLVLINFKNPAQTASDVALTPSDATHKEYQKSLVLPLFLVVFAIALWFVAIPAISGFDIPAEVSPTQKASFDIMAKTLKTLPVFGSGLESFPYVYAKFKDASLNQTNYWGTNFNDSASEAITWTTTSGAFGAVALLSFIALFGIYALKKIGESKGQTLDFPRSDLGKSGFFSRQARAGIFASWIFILASKFFYSTSLPLELAFWLLPALFIVSCFVSDSPISPIGPIGPIGETWRYFFKSGSFGTLGIFFALMVVLLGALIGSYFSAQRFAAEKIFIKAASAENTAENRDGIINSITGSISADPYEVRYFRALSQVLFQKMNDIVAEIQKRPEADRKATPEESTQIQNLTVSTINSVQRAVALDPKNVGVSVDAAESYRNLVSLVQGAEDLAIQNYERASEMEPINPFIKTQLGQLYLVKSNLFGNGSVAPDMGLAAKARGIFEKALELNPNYANARYFLALIQDKAGERQVALENFKLLRATNPKNELIAQIVQNLENGIPALGYPPQPATPPESPSTGAAKGVPSAK